MKQEFWSLGDDFVIRDEHGTERYHVDGRVFSFGDKLSLRDTEGNELAFISQRLLSWGPSYQIHRPGYGPVEVAKELFTFFHCRFAVDGPGDEDYEATGDFLDHEYEIHGSRGPAAVVTKRWLSWTDSYGIEIAEGEDPVLHLATAVVIDLVCHDGKKKH
ncbi:LURP-one-related/scramblase family protein [Luteolibacter yonseiensis]